MARWVLILTGMKQADARHLVLSVALLWPLHLVAQDVTQLETDLHAQLGRVLVTTQVPGATFGVALPDGSSFAVAAGQADTAKGQAMPAGGRVLTGSTGKTFSAVLALQLVSEAHFELDAPIARYLGVIMLELPAGIAWGHSGFMPGYRTEMFYFPEHRFGVALAINSTARGSLTRSLTGILNELAETVVAAGF